MTDPISRRTWASLSLYESPELVRRFAVESAELSSAIHEEGGAGIAEGKQEAAEAVSIDTVSREIAAYFAQGREYFRSAAGASELVRPLILYYGVVALARGAVRFLEPLGPGPAPSHGLSARGWGDLTETPETVPDLPVAATRTGTFSELARLTGAAEGVRIPYISIPKVITARSPGVAPAAGSRLTLREVLGQIPDVAELFERTFGEHSRRLRCEVQATGDLEPGTRAVGEQVPPDQDVRHFAWLGVLPSPGSPVGTPDAGWVQERVACGRLVDRGANALLHFARDPANEIAGANLFELYYDAGSSDRPRRELPVATAGAGGEYLKLRTEGGVVLSSLLALHLAAYAASSLVRYHPGYWAMLTGRTAGDSVGPVLSAAISAVEERYPALILEVIGG